GADGGYPVAGLIFDTDGALYGTTQSYESYGRSTINAGTVFKLTPPAAGKTQWTLSVLYTFPTHSSDGASPSGRLIFDTHGALYGTTQRGGSSSSGTVFKLTPPTSGTGPWTETRLFEFAPPFGKPNAGLIFDSHGALYGTGMGTGFGEVFKLTRPTSGNGPWTETTLFQYPLNYNDKGALNGDLTFDSRGALYGTFTAGPIFKLTPPASGNGPWTETVLYKVPRDIGSIALIWPLPSMPVFLCFLAPALGGNPFLRPSAHPPPSPYARRASSPPKRSKRLDPAKTAQPSRPGPCPPLQSAGNQLTGEFTARLAL